ncbi:MAG: aspartyl/glutamyl-tRNA amidotransferase subunit C [Chloroflexi bacterium]|nr:MAG: aspartyl/glutamyl-tRNA amidotransferase subunit C [Chloroflexota bacterium]
MTQISRDDVQHLAQLSSLQLGDDEIDALQVIPTYQVSDRQNVWRNDVVIDYGVTREQLLDLSVESDQHQVKVPKVL